MKTTALTAPAAALLMAKCFEADAVAVETGPRPVPNPDDLREAQRLSRFRYEQPRDGIKITGGMDGITITGTRETPEKRLASWIITLRWFKVVEPYAVRYAVRGWCHGDPLSIVDTARLVNADQQLGWIIASALEAAVNLDDDERMLRDTLVATLRDQERKRQVVYRVRPAGAMIIG